MANGPDHKDDGKGDIDWAQVRPQILKLALELGPLVIFFFVNLKGAALLAAFPVLGNSFSKPIFLATAVFMAAMVVSLLLSWLLLKKLAVMPVVTGIVVLVFGGITLWLNDDTFIKMKPTVVNGLFAAVLLGGLLFKQSLLRYVFGDVYKLKPQGWTVLTFRWGLFFVFLAILNEVVWRTTSTDFWVAFKVWATMPITVVFTLFQLPVLTKYAPDPEHPAAEGGEPTI